MTGDVSNKHPWPFKAAQVTREGVDVNALRDRAIDLLKRERRAMHTGELAGLLGVLTHQVQVALQQPLIDRAVHFSSSEGWDIVAPYTLIESRRDDGQGSL